MIHDGQEWSSRRQIYRTRPVKGRLSLLDKPTRRNGRREGATLDAHRRSWKLTLASRGRRRRAPSGQDQVDKHRVGKLAGPGWPRHRRRASNGSQRFIGRGRATTFGHRTSTAACLLIMPEARRRRATNDRKGLGTFLSHLVGGFDLMLGHRSQALDRIGANGFMVLRMGVP